MLRPQRPRRPDPVALATPIPKATAPPPKPAAEPDVSPPWAYSGTTPEPNPGPKPRPVIPRDPDGTLYTSHYHDRPEPHHVSRLVVGLDGEIRKTFEVTGPSLFGNFRRLKVLLEEWRAAQEKTPAQQ